MACLLNAAWTIFCPLGICKASASEYSTRITRKITAVAENIFLMSLMTKLTLTLNDPHDDA